jgi:hypothetical protein
VLNLATTEAQAFPAEPVPQYSPPATLFSLQYEHCSYYADAINLL